MLEYTISVWFVTSDAVKLSYVRVSPTMLVAYKVNLHGGFGRFVCDLYIACMIHLFSYNRSLKIQRLRWQLGAVLPADIQEKLNFSEREFFKSYSDLLGSCMTNIDLDFNSGMQILRSKERLAFFYLLIDHKVDHHSFIFSCGRHIYRCYEKLHPHFCN